MKAVMMAMAVRWQIAVATLGGIAVVWPATFLYSRHVHLRTEWVSSAVSLTAAWLTFVVFGIAVWECVQVARGLRPARVIHTEPRDWANEWRMLAVLGLGVVIGWIFFK